MVNFSNFEEYPAGFRKHERVFETQGKQFKYYFKVSWDFYFQAIGVIGVNSQGNINNRPQAFRHNRKSKFL